MGVWGSTMANASAPPSWLVALKARSARGDRPLEKAAGRWLGDFLTESTPSGLLDTEFDLLDACAKGSPFSAYPGQPPPWPTLGPNDLAKLKVRSGLVRFLAMGGDDTAPVHEAGVVVLGAYVDSDLDLRGATCVGRLSLRNCLIDGQIKIEDASLGILDLTGSRIKGLLGNRAAIKGSVFFEHGFQCDRPIQLFGASIGGGLQCSGGRFNAPTSQSALMCNRARIGGSVMLNAGFVAIGGGVDLRGAKIRGDLTVSGGRILARRAFCSLNAAGAEIGGSVFLNAGFRARESVLLDGAGIGGKLVASGGRLFTSKGRISLSLNAATTGGDVLLNEGFAAGGPVSLRGARIGGDLDVSTARLIGPYDGKGAREFALDGASSSIAANVNAERCEALGGVLLWAAQIGETLMCHGALFENPGGEALNAVGARIKGSICIGQSQQPDTATQGEVAPGRRFTARGLVNLSGAQITGDVDASGGLFVNPEGEALSLKLTHIDGEVALKQRWAYDRPGDTRSLVVLDQFEARGGVSLYGAVIGMHLDCTGGLFQAPPPDPARAPDDQTAAIDAQIADIAGCVFLTRPANSLVSANAGLKGFSSVGEVRLLAARIGLQLNCFGGQFVNTTPAEQGQSGAALALNLQRARVGLDILLGPAKGDDNRPANIEGSLDLRGATAEGLSDRLFVGAAGPDPACFPETIQTTAGGNPRCELRLDGFTYGRLDPDADLSAKARRAWLLRQPREDTSENLLNQPFDYLASVLDSMGRDEEARRIRIFKEDCLTRAIGRDDKFIAVALFEVELALFWNGLVWPGVAGLVAAAWAASRWRSGARSAEWLWRATFGGLVGYGYRPGRGLGVALMVALLAGAYYQAAQAGGDLTLEKSKGGAESPASATAKPFHPYIYSLEVMLPVAKLGEADAWKPADKGFVLRTASGRRIVAFDREVTQKIVWLETAFGWLASGILVAMVSGFVKAGGARP